MYGTRVRKHVPSPRIAVRPGRLAWHTDCRSAAFSRTPQTMHARPVLRLLPALRRALSSSSSSAPSGAATETAAEKQRRALLERAFGQEDFAETLGIGGAGPVLQDLFRRAFASRLVQKDDAKTLGLRHVKGIMLHGAPGTGKTLIARKIAELLGDRRPKVVAGPDIYDHLLGQSEAKIRELFRASEDEWRRDKHNSALHVIVFDEIDAIARQRGGDKGGAGAGRDSVVTQLLAKIDGLQRQENLLIIGTTNRLDLVDPAVLRPGRLEVREDAAVVVAAAGATAAAAPAPPPLLLHPSPCYCYYCYYYHYHYHYHYHHHHHHYQYSSS